MFHMSELTKTDSSNEKETSYKQHSQLDIEEAFFFLNDKANAQKF